MCASGLIQIPCYELSILRKIQEHKYALHIFLYVKVVDSFDMQALYDEALPAFDIMGKKSFFLGEVGNGAKMKLVVNMIMGR